MTDTNKKETSFLLTKEAIQKMEEQAFDYFDWIYKYITLNLSYDDVHEIRIS